MTEPLAAYYSEWALARYRVRVELAWLEFLGECPEVQEVPAFSQMAKAEMRALVQNFREENALQIKAIESRINHDVKAVEYWLREMLWANPEVQRVSSFLHFGLTSDDVNNISYALAVQESRDKVLLPAVSRLKEKLASFAIAWADLPMLSRTHGQPASPTTVGKECANFAYRVHRQEIRLQQVDILGKVNGAVGNYSALEVAYPGISWPGLCRSFIEGLGLRWNPLTTQIEPHDWLAEFLDAVARLNTIVLALDRDLWGYISLGYFRQKAMEEEVGSSTMPHKVNPIDFENSEGNLGLASSILRHMAEKLPVSRWQRDLSDSTVLRNLGVGLGHAIVGWEACLRGLSKIAPDKEVLEKDLEERWEVLAEAAQTLLRKAGEVRAYEVLKEITRNRGTMTKGAFQEAVRELALPPEEKARLFSLSPRDYTGVAVELARQIGSFCEEVR